MDPAAEAIIQPYNRHGTAQMIIARANAVSRPGQNTEHAYSRTKRGRYISKEVPREYAATGGYGRRAAIQNKEFE